MTEHSLYVERTVVAQATTTWQRRLNRFLDNLESRLLDAATKGADELKRVQREIRRDGRVEVWSGREELMREVTDASRPLDHFIKLLELEAADEP